MAPAKANGANAEATSKKTTTAKTANKATKRKTAPASGTADAAGGRSKKKRKTDKNIAESLPIPKSTKDFTEADRAMWDMRKVGQYQASASLAYISMQAGKGWKEIGEEWERLTGQKAASTTLPNRFTRIKEHIGDFTAPDDELLLKCKKDLESTWSKEIWAMISEQMVIKGGEKFSATSIERRYKQLAGIVKVEEDGDGEMSSDA